jgi:hypothetical protein
MNKLNRPELYALGEAIAAELGAPWRLQGGRQRDDTSRWWDVYLVRADDPACRVELFYGTDTGRLIVKGDYPRHHDGTQAWDARDALPQVTFDPTRPADRLAADLARRFLPLFLQKYAEIKVRVEETTSADARRLALADRLAAAWGLRTRGPRGPRQPYEGGEYHIEGYVEDGSRPSLGTYVVCHVNGPNSVKLTVETGAELAGLIAQAMAAYKKQQRGV